MAAPVYPRRIMGVETEFAVAAFRDGEAVLSPDHISRYLFRPIAAKYRSSNVFTDNGSRLYLDVGAHPEFATAECDSVTQLLNYDKSGEVIYQELVEEANAALAGDRIGGTVYLFKNNVDSRGNSYGAHENYLISRELVLKPFAKQLLPFMVTRQLICGAGLIRDGQFVISQRADQVWEAVSSATTRTRPIINTRDEAHADSNRFRRMHVIVGDSNMSEPTFALKIGATLLVLEVLEAGIALPDFELEDPIASIRDIAVDPTGQAELALKNGGTTTALEVQRATLDAAKQWLESRPDEGTPNEEMARIVELWQRVLDAIAAQDLSSIDTEIDWVIKRKLLGQVKDRLGADWDHPKLAQIDLTYHDIDRNRGLFYLLERKGLAARWTTDEAIREATKLPPQTTRAALRGRFLEQARAAGADFSVTWDGMRVNKPLSAHLKLPDPFDTESEELDSLISAIWEHTESETADQTTRAGDDDRG